MAMDYVASTVVGRAHAEAFIMETGGLPEVLRAATDMRTVFDQTRQEIEDARFDADRFPVDLSEAGIDMLRHDLEHAHANPMRLLAIEAEGAAGDKRARLLIRLMRAENDMFNLIQTIVEIRADMIISQQAFSPGSEADLSSSQS